jgi:glycosyltransferase involved in cell wall biosynthesis
VGKKIKNQTAIWGEQGHETVLFCLTPAEVPIPNARQFIFESKSGLFKRETARSSALKKMLAAVREYKPDIIYLRFGLYSFPLHRLFNIAPVVLEINSDDRPEYHARGPFFYWFNLATRGLTIGAARGIIVPSHELEKIILQKYKKPIAVIANGFDLRDVEPLPPPRHTDPVITLVGSPGMVWHGVDKLFSFAKMHPDIKVNIVGYSQKDVEMPAPPNLHLHGFMNKDQVRAVLADTDVACGSLALHRNNMEEASVLKSREALALGIPIIIAYRDTDLDKVEVETILKISNTENNIVENAAKIRAFAYSMIGRRVDVNSIAPYLDQKQKEKKRLAFFQQILSEINSGPKH